MLGLKQTTWIVLAFIIAFVVKLTTVARSHNDIWSQVLQANALIATSYLPPNSAHEPIASSISSNHVELVDPDAHCPFRHSPLYRSIFVYPSPRDALFESMRSDRAGASNNGTVPMWPWLDMNEEFRQKQFLSYNVSQDDMNHFAVEQYVHDIVTHPNSCLQTNDPETAKLFYIPLLETLYWRGLERLGKLRNEWVKKQMTPYGEALLEAIEGNYFLWEELFGITSEFWKRKHGADHFFVMAEPCNGLRHRSKARASTNYIGTQRQNRPPIVISQELSVSYVRRYPKCAAKNIVMPYANINGKWFRGYFEQEAKALLPQLSAAIENRAATTKVKAGDYWRPVLVHLDAGNHGQCGHLRRGLLRNHRCSKSHNMTSKYKISRQVQMHLSTFCPCPAGDSPSARRMNDAVVAGCIPVVLSADYVWPLSKDVDPTSEIDPSTFSLRLNFSAFGQHMFAHKQCKRVYGNLTLEEYLETVPHSEIRRLQEGMKKVAPLYEYYQRRNMSDTPLSDHLLPDGGAAQALVHELAKRAVDNRWEQCQDDLKVMYQGEPTKNPC